MYVAGQMQDVVRPVRELRGFKKVTLAAGESKVVSFELSKRAFAYWNVEVHDWFVSTGVYQIQIGTDAETIVLEVPIQITGTIAIKPVFNLNSTLGELMTHPIAGNIVKKAIGSMMVSVEGGGMADENSDIEAAGDVVGQVMGANGQEPGYAENQAMLLATCSNTIKTLTIREMYNYSTAPVRDDMAPSYGFDEAPEYQCALEDPDTQIYSWGLTIKNIANNLGYEIEGFKTSFEKCVATEPIPVGWGTIEPGKVAAVWVRTCGIVEGREAIVIEHINRMSQDIAPDCPHTDRVGQISVRIEGDPNLQVDMNVSLPEQPEELSYGGYVFTAMRIVNAIPHVCAGKPGILTIHDFPMALPDNVFRSEATHIEHKICKAK